MDTIIGGRGKPGDVGLQSRSHPMKEHDLRAQGAPFKSPGNCGKYWGFKNKKLRQILTLRGPGKNYKHATTIDVLSDDVLLEIFDV
jgi:hypothetical protein